LWEPFFTEELKLARQLGYKVIPFRGYIYEKRPSPFTKFVDDIYQKRLEAQSRNVNAMSYIYKLVMNSLYGRFGINPESTITEICNAEKYE